MAAGLLFDAVSVTATPCLSTVVRRDGPLTGPTLIVGSVRARVPQLLLSGDDELGPTALGSCLTVRYWEDPNTLSARVLL